MGQNNDVRKCPYCGIAFSIDGVNAFHTPINLESPLGLMGRRTTVADSDGLETTYTLTAHRCPSCKKPVMWLKTVWHVPGAISEPPDVVRTMLVYPPTAVKQLPSEIPEQYAKELREAHAILHLSPKASAALSRRSLQTLLREKEGVQENSLFKEIKKVLEAGHLPPYLARDLDAIRNVGNFATHPIKDDHTGEIVDVEPGESEWTIELLEELLHFYFVDEHRSRSRRDALNKKLKAAGKKPLLE